MPTPKGSMLLVALIIFLVMVSIYTLLIMVIWNNVLIQKIKGANLQKLNFWDALAIAVFFSLVTGSTTVINKCDLNN